MIKTVEISGTSYTFDTKWNGQELSGNIIALDTETELINEEEPWRVPQLSIISVSNGTENYLLHPSRLAEFLEKHKDKHYAMFNCAFDFWVMVNFLSERESLPLWEIAEGNRLHDAMLLDSLYRLAENDEYPSPRNLAIVAKRWCRMEVNKEDPYRLRYGEIIGKDIDEVEEGFATYAIKDTIVTYFTFVNLYKKAKELAQRAGVSKDALEKYGPLTEAVQVKAALSLYKITTDGLSLDVSFSHKLNNEILSCVESLTKEFNDTYPDLFKKHKKTGELEYTEHGVPRKSTKALVAIFEGVAKRLAEESGVEVKIPKTATGKVSTSMVEWGDYIDRSGFLTSWDKFTEQTKLLQFFSKLQVDKIHPRYNYFVRTGRTSQQSPNCFTGDMELLTGRGFVCFKDLRKDDLVAQWEESGRITYVIPLAYIREENREVFDLVGDDYHLSLTPDHRCLYYNGQFHVVPASIYAQKLEGNYLVLPHSILRGVRKSPPPSSYRRETVYCVTVPSGFIVVRKNGKACVQCNCQQIPKNSMRNIIIPQKGHLLVAIDYSFIELRTLAAVFEKLFKKSVLADVIREGKDPHAWTGGMLINMEYDEFLAKKKTDPKVYDKWRQNAKALNFGIPGGLSPISLLEYAKNVYGIKDWDINISKHFRDRLCNEVYPELGKYLNEDGMYNLAMNLDCSIEDAWEAFAIKGERNFGIVNALKNIVGGKPKKNGEAYSEAYKASVWTKLNNLNNNATLYGILKERKPGLEAVKHIFWTGVTTLTGRIRGRVSFTQCKNSPFQGLAADGAKLALFRLVKEGYKLVNFVHDEIIFELPDLGGYVDRKTVDYLSKVMCEEMEKVTPGIPILTEYLVSKCWTKKGKMKIEEDKIWPI
jgi:DNA polymerase I-like protein with 3'-5' exonuclease and polymerase domains